MKKILSIDPGETTGIAAFENDELTFAMTVSCEKLLSNGFLNKLISISSPDTVLIEGVPLIRSDPKQLILVAELRRWFKVAGYEVELIQPSQWKSFAERAKIPGQHARDAATMGKWWIDVNDYN